MERVEPTSENRYGSKNKTLSHPAFGQVVVSRVQGGRMNLYGTDFIPDGFITISISQSQLERSLSRDWHFPKQEIIEIAMSEAQWATFISSLNIGGGVPCTIQKRDGKSVPQIERTETQREKFSDEMKRNFTSAKKGIRDLIEKVKDMSLPKGETADIVGELTSIRMRIDSNANFVADSFDKHIEDKIEEAKTEAHGYLMRTVVESGIASLSGNTTPHKAIDDASGM